MFCSNRRRSSIVIPSSFADLVNSISLLSIVSLYLTSLYLHLTVARNLSALTIISFCLNQPTADSGSKVSKSPVSVTSGGDDIIIGKIM